MERLRELELGSVEPLTHPMDATNRLDDDAPGPTLTTEAFMAGAPATAPPFLKVPRVLGGGGGE
jgi:aspartyl/glutamyl-tRNA(Asn/Gln) amidotransferase C subunit